jgi:DNA-binding NtrC family response regulator
VSPGDPVHGASILIVDDEPEVASLLAEILEEDAHRVETASNGVTALDKLRDGTYDLIISDLKMPHLDGPGLYREVARRHPHMVQRMIFVTGDTLGPESAEFLRQSAAPTFDKPFEPQDVRRVIYQVLRARSS